MTHRTPYVGEGADGARRSAQIDREEADCLDAGTPRWAELLESANRWERQAHELETADGQPSETECGICTEPLTYGSETRLDINGNPAHLECVADAGAWA